MELWFFMALEFFFFWVVQRIDLTSLENYSLKYVLVFWHVGKVSYSEICYWGPKREWCFTTYTILSSKVATIGTTRLCNNEPNFFTISKFTTTSSYSTSISYRATFICSTIFLCYTTLIWNYICRTTCIYMDIFYWWTNTIQPPL